MAAFTGVDLNRRGAGGADARGVVHRLLIAFNHRAGGFRFQPQQGFRQQGGFAGARAGDRVQHQLVLAAKRARLRAARRLFYPARRFPLPASAAGFGPARGYPPRRDRSADRPPPSGWGKVIGFHAGNIHHLARAGAKGRCETPNAGYAHRLLYKGCLHRSRRLYTYVTPELLLFAESVSRHPPQFAAGRSDTAGSGARAAR